jgi:pantoate kinase
VTIDMLKRARAFSPAGISSFFEICDRTSDGQIMSNPELIGARGGGFSPDKGVLTEVTISDSKETEVHVFINKILCPEAETTMSVVNMLIKKINQPYEITVMHNVDIPIGAGFGSSAAGSLGTALALGKVLGLNLTYNQLGRIAHVAEVKSKTGLGTVGPLLFGGCGLSIAPGAPGIARLDRIPVPSDYRLIMGTFNPYQTKKFLSSDKKRELINKWGRITLKKILENPSLENFMKSCKDFAIGTGFVTERVKKLIDLSERAGAVGATQNMIGEAVHALVKVDHMMSVYDIFRTVLPEEKIITAKIDSQGARLIG